MILSKLQKLGMREKLLMAVAACLVMALIVNYSVVAPVFNRYEELSAAIENTEWSLKYNLNVLKGKTQVRAEYDSVCGLLAKASLPAEDIDEIKGEIETIATEAGLQYSTMSHNEPRKTEFYDEYLIEIGKYESDMQNLLVFLHALNQTPGMLRVSRMNIKAVKGGSKVTGSILISKVMIPNQVGSESTASADSGAGE